MKSLIPTFWLYFNVTDFAVKEFYSSTEYIISIHYISLSNSVSVDEQLADPQFLYIFTMTSYSMIIRFFYPGFPM